MYAESQAKKCLEDAKDYVLRELLGLETDRRSFPVARNYSNFFFLRHKKNLKHKDHQFVGHILYTASKAYQNLIRILSFWPLLKTFSSAPLVTPHAV